MLLCGEKMGLDTYNSTQVNWQCQVTISGNSSWFVFYPQLHRFRWLTPHFEGNHNIFLSDTILLKTQKCKIFMNMPKCGLYRGGWPPDNQRGKVNPQKKLEKRQRLQPPPQIDIIFHLTPTPTPTLTPLGKNYIDYTGHNLEIKLCDFSVILWK